MLLPHARFPLRQMLTVGLLPAPLKAAYYRSRGARVGRGVGLGVGAVIVAGEIEIGEGAQIGFGTFLRARRVSIGRFARIGSVSFLDAETIEIGEDAKISEQVFVGGLSSPHSHFHLGARTILMQHTFINVARPVHIGDDTGIGGKCTIFTHGSWQNELDGYPVSFAPVTIGSNVWIPWQVFVMPGDGATLGAGSLITRDVPAGSLAVGSPARVIRTADQYPARLDAGQKAEHLRQMLTEFCEHLVHGGFQVRRLPGEAAEMVEVERGGPALRLIVRYAAPEAGPFAQPLDAYLSLPPLDDLQPALAETPGLMWLDLARKQRGGASNPLGEELAEFLKRYGIRFRRTP